MRSVGWRGIRRTASEPRGAPDVYSIGFRNYGPMHPAEVGSCLIIAAACYAALLTHVVSCAHDRLWGLLAFGAVLVPVGILHGIGVWFGVW
ncbi:MAG TPA: hypothetical protein VK726_08360 [Acetobacteraceae bacterium]|jgi:hypothetical protein|nr:hypothetical protein [Acetobacteraceae bacterium]